MEYDSKNSSSSSMYSSSSTEDIDLENHESALCNMHKNRKRLKKSWRVHSELDSLDSYGSMHSFLSHAHSQDSLHQAIPLSRPCHLSSSSSSSKKSHDPRITSSSQNKPLRKFKAHLSHLLHLKRSEERQSQRH